MIQQVVNSLQRHSKYYAQVAAAHIFPNRCLSCGAAVVGCQPFFCVKCWQKLQVLFQEKHYCSGCGKTAGLYTLEQGRCSDCLTGKLVIQEIIRVGEYHKPLNELILAFKYANRQALDKFLGTLLAHAILNRRAHQRVDVIMPIPLHWFRYCMRKYNQSELLADQVVRILRRYQPAIEYRSDLVRTRYTTPQTQLPHSKRKTNLINAFGIRTARHIQGKRVCLIDDVTTSGTTLQAAAKVLLKAGAAGVSAAVLAVASPMSP